MMQSEPGDVFENFQRTGPPVAGATRNISYPKIHEGRLVNGLQVLGIEDRKLPRVAVKIGFPLGRVHNPADNQALVSLALSLVQQGTRSHDARQLAAEIDQYAIGVSDETGMEYSLLSVSVLSWHLEKALNLLAEMVKHPSFPEDELARLKARWRSRLIGQRSDPNFLAREDTFRCQFGSHPYSRLSIPLDDLEALTSERVRDFYFQRYGAESARVIMAGPLQFEEMVEKIKQSLGQWHSGEAVAGDWGALPPQRRRLRLVHRPGSVQCRLVVSGRAPSRTHSDFIPFRVANQVFGGSASSRLFLNLREDKGYTYGAYSSIQSYQEAGLFLASASIDSSTCVPAVEQTLYELARTGSEPATKEELERCQSELVGTFVRTIETAPSIAGLELYRRLNRLPRDYYQAYIPKIQEVTTGQVTEMARKYLDPENCLITVVGDRQSLGKGLAQFGSVEVLDIQGKEMPSA